MQYNPGVYDRSGEIIAAGTMQAAQTQADLMRELGEKARQTATAVAGFAAGGPAGAAMASGGGSGGGGGGGEGIFSTLLNAYSQNKQLEAKASSYDDIGKILNTAMFKDNPDASAAFGNLQKEKDPLKKVMGYEQLFSLVGPMSNMMMAQGRMEQAPVIQTQRDTAATNRMYEAERLRREREAQAKVAAGQGTMTMPSNINADVIP